MGVEVIGLQGRTSSILYLKHFWDLFEKDFMEIMSHFYEFGKISSGCGSSFITIIPKTKDPTSLNEYRPINLIGVVSKVISKIFG